MYFHIRDGDILMKDANGQECESIEYTVREARVFAQEILSDRVKYGKILGQQQFEVVDEAGAQMFILPFMSVLRMA